MTHLSATQSLAGAVLAVIAGAHLLSAAPARAQGEGWTVLFDGKGLDQFNNIGDANWRIEEGAVVSDKGTGFLVTKQPYGDFQLRAEFWADEDANSGIYSPSRAISSTLRAARASVTARNSLDQSRPLRLQRRTCSPLLQAMIR